MTAPRSDSANYYRLHSAWVIAKRKTKETWYAPGIYISATAGLLLAYLTVSSYTKSIGSGGFDSSLNPVFDLLAGLLIGAFGESFFLNFFSEGPFLFALIIAFIPVLMHLTISSVFRFGLEKNVGALRLIAFGPADGTSYIIGSMLKDVFFYSLYLVVLTCFFLLGAVTNNLLLGPKFYYALLTIFSFALCISAYGIMASVLTSNSGSAVALFSTALLVFALVNLGTFVNVQGYIRDLSSTVSMIIKWISPFFFWQWAMKAVDASSAGQFVLALCGMLLVSLVLVFASHLSQRYREAD
jgi:hypothetical protein